jgi:hypothetical protein
MHKDVPVQIREQSGLQTDVGRKHTERIVQTCDTTTIDVAKRLAEVTNDEALILYASEIEEYATEAILYQYRYNVEAPVFHAVTLVNKEEWEELRFEDANYYGLAFDQATGWSNLLKVNKANIKHEVK